MGNAFPKREENHLELYLNDVYENECLFKAAQEEVKFIKSGIETLTENLANDISDIFSEYTDIDKILREETFKTSALEIYPDGSVLSSKNDTKEKSIKLKKHLLLQVGSMYDGTKNYFPDEFDFIIAYCGIEEGRRGDTYILKTIVAKCISAIMKKKSFTYTSLDETRRIYLNTQTPVYSHGQICTIEFFYTNGIGNDRYIKVNLSLGYKMPGNMSANSYVRDFTRFVEPKSFMFQILSMENCVYIGGNITFAEAEKSFMKTTLSEHHRKVCRILKFLINGHGDDKTMEKCSEKGAEGLKEGSVYLEVVYSSNMIKTMMIYHHEDCKNPKGSATWPCILQILNKMCTFPDTNTFPSFEGPRQYQKLCLVSDLRSLIRKLKSMQKAGGTYSYQTYLASSITMQFLEREHATMLDHVRKQETLYRDLKKA